MLRSAIGAFLLIVAGALPAAAAELGDDGLHKEDWFTITFRDLDDSQIQHYVDTDKPFDCAGSFKAEGFGIALFEKMEGSDFNSLVGLPLIRLIDLLKKFGVDPLRPGDSA